jgi:L-asparaginase / beta-aspartyl-peptidase
MRILALAAASLLLGIFPAITMADGPVAIAIHGGAGTIRRADLTAETEAAIRADLERALRAGHAVLADGGDAMDAVVAAVTVLEDSPNFNAGRGAVYTADRRHELDASIMDGRDRSAGAVAGVSNVRNPILLARAVMTDSPHVLLSGAGAQEFAIRQGLELVPQEYYDTEHRLEQWERAREADQRMAVIPVEYRLGTVGAVALDADGHLAAATSTGGTTYKRWGRVGDSPIIGAGTWADDQTVAISATGDGEYFIRNAVTHDIHARMAYLDEDVETAANAVIDGPLTTSGGTGGVICVDRVGRVAFAFNTDGMYRGSIGTDGELTVAIYGDE